MVNKMLSHTNENNSSILHSVKPGVKRIYISEADILMSKQFNLDNNRKNKRKRTSEKNEEDENDPNSSTDNS